MIKLKKNRKILELKLVDQSYQQQQIIFWSVI